MKLLFFPSDLGGGFGHISRCLAVAHEAVRRKHHCAFVINTRKFESQINTDFTTFVSQRSRTPSFVRSLFKRVIGQVYSRKSPLFTEISSLDYQVIRDGLSDTGRIKKNIARYLHIIDTFHPDLLIGDTNLLVWILSQITHIPVVQIVRYASHPQTAHLLWWKNEPDSLVPPDSSALFNPLLHAMGLSSIKRATDLLQGDRYIVPSLPEIEPIPDDGKTFFVGALTRSIANNNVPPWFQEIDNDRPLVYITLGGGAGPVGNTLFFATILETFADKAVQVIVSTSSKFDATDLPVAPPHI
ncbi:MAG: hypothetical protein JXB42_12850, partial [Deltaproteobacteria bacterium]|nr:hypothetical protein [Deltaproteobacteria bacterium]